MAVEELKGGVLKVRLPFRPRVTPGLTKNHHQNVKATRTLTYTHSQQRSNIAHPQLPALNGRAGREI